MRRIDDRDQLAEPARSALCGISEIEDSERNKAIVDAPATVVTWLEPDALATFE